MKLTPTQRTAIERAMGWYFGGSHEKKLFVVGGYAGTGKTTIVKLIIDVLGLTKYNVLYVAYTGKATNVLRMKGNFAHTIHKTFYQIYGSGSKVQFKLKTSLPSIVKLIVVDEMSMVNDKIMDDILSFGIPVIGLGDPGQLPPIFGGNRFIGDPDAFLTDVMRQDDKSGILTLATMAREGKMIPFGNYGESKVVPFDKIDAIEKYDTVLCWRNSTRIRLNMLIREKLNLTHNYPTKGEKLICLNNSYVHELEHEGINVFIVNGLNCVAVDNVDEIDDETDTFKLKYKPDFVQTNSTFFETRCEKGLFDTQRSGKVWKEVDEERDDDIVRVDFGYALTVHKSQGSEWGRVLIINDYAGNGNDFPKWLYTAITRGRYSVTLTNI